MENKTKEPVSFSINRDFYNRELKATVESKFVPSFCIVFSTVLPFQLPLKDGTNFQLIFNDKASVFYFNKFGYMRMRPIYEKDEGIPIAVMRTRVELASLTSEDMSQVTTQRIWEYFSYLINRLNCYIYSYRMQFEDIYSFNLGQGNLDCVISYEIVKLPEWQPIKSGPLLINTNLDSIQYNLPEEIALAVERFGAYIAISKNPFLPSRKFFAEARRYLSLSNYRETIIYLQITVESLLNNILRLCLVHAGKSESEVDVWMLETPFSTRFKRWIPQFIGGDC